MHQCWYISEVLERMCFYLMLDESRTGRTTLAALARTCKAFADPAGEKLWYQLQKLEHLLRCLPQDCWEDFSFEIKAHGRTFTFNTIRFTRELTDADWKSVEKPRAWIREFLHKSWYSNLSVPHAAMLDSIEGSLGQRLLPNLRVLHWAPPEHCNNTEFVRWVQLLVGPHLTDLTLQNPSFTSSTEAELLIDVDVPFSRLKSLDLDIQRANIPSLLSVSSLFATNLSAIEELALPRVSATAWKHLASLPRLRKLHLYAPQAGDLGTPSSRLPSNPPPFTCLRKLYISNTAIATALELLTSVPKWTLEHLVIGSDPKGFKPEGPGMAKLLYTAVASHCASDRLDFLLLGPHCGDAEIEDPPRAALAEYTLAGDSLSRLFPFSNLVRIMLRPPAGFTIDDTVIRDLASAWSVVETLHLSSGSGVHSPPPATTLNALRLLAGHCPYLRELMLPINALDVPAFSSYRNHRITQTALAVLDVAISPIDDSLAVARFISGHFTVIESLDTSSAWRWDDENYEYRYEEERAERRYHQRWMEVQMMLLYSEIVRGEERCWAGDDSGGKVG
uniref:F-box domain-containing protein n=1 Tax=Mycena chlorophos TaxID=658473 RepID=A0ABQ0LEU5_MYCCL|nr:predicted protein [Mycena chlorophos]